MVTCPLDQLKMDEIDGFELLLLSKIEVRLLSDIDPIAPKRLLERHL